MGSTTPSTSSTDGKVTSNGSVCNGHVNKVTSNGSVCNGHKQDRPLITPVPAFSIDQPEPESSDSWKRAAVFIAIDVLLLALLAPVCCSLVQHYRLKSNDNTTSTSEGPALLLEDAPFCLPCREVYLTEDAAAQNRYQVKQRWDEREGMMLCCAESHDNLNRLVGVMYNRAQYRRKRARGDVTWNENNTEADALRGAFVSHLSLRLNTSALSAGSLQEKNGTFAVPLLDPTTAEQEETAALDGRKAANADHNQNNTNGTSPTTGTRYAAVVRDGSVRIQHSGHYYIYSHLPFNFSVSPDETATQFLLRVRDGQELVLLENSVYPCVIGTPEDKCEYSFVGGTFLLEEEDELSLRVSHRACIQREKEMSFGLQLM